MGEFKPPCFGLTSILDLSRAGKPSKVGRRSCTSGILGCLKSGATRGLSSSTFRTRCELAGTLMASPGVSGLIKDCAAISNVFVMNRPKPRIRWPEGMTVKWKIRDPESQRSEVSDRNLRESAMVGIGLLRRVPCGIRLCLPQSFTILLRRRKSLI